MTTPLNPKRLTVSEMTVNVPLSWNTVPNAEGYRIYRDGVKIYDGKENSILDVIPIGANPIYKVSSYNADGASGQTIAPQIITNGHVPNVLQDGSEIQEAIVAEDGRNILLKFNKPFPSRFKADRFLVSVSGVNVPIEKVHKIDETSILIKLWLYITRCRIAYINYTSDNNDGVADFSAFKADNRSLVVKAE